MKRKRKSKALKKIKKFFSKIGTLNIVLICVGLFLVRFNSQMIELYKLHGTMPETYACAVIAAILGECGICGWIRISKVKKRERQWEKEDRKEENYKNSIEEI